MHLQEHVHMSYALYIAHNGYAVIMYQRKGLYQQGQPRDMQGTQWCFVRNV